LARRIRRRLSWYIIWSAIFFFLIACFFTVIISLPAWRINTIEISGSNIISKAHIRKMAEPFIGKNIFLVDYSDLKIDMGKIRQLKDFGIWRGLPSSLVIKILEREPFAILISSGSSIIIDEDGLILAIEGKGKQQKDSFISIGNISHLPVVRGVDEKKIFAEKLDQNLSKSIKIAINELSRFLAKSKLQLELAGEDNLNILVEDVLKVKFGSLENISEKIFVLEALLKNLKRSWSEIAYIDIRISSAPVVKFKNT